MLIYEFLFVTTYSTTSYTFSKQLLFTHQFTILYMMYLLGMVDQCTQAVDKASLEVPQR